VKSASKLFWFATVHVEKPFYMVRTNISLKYRRFMKGSPWTFSALCPNLKSCEVSQNRNINEVIGCNVWSIMLTVWKPEVYFARVHRDLTDAMWVGYTWVSIRSNTNLTNDWKMKSSNKDLKKWSGSFVSTTVQ